MKGLMGLVVLFSAVLMLAGVSFAGNGPIEIDTDGDGVLDINDYCPGTVPEWGLCSDPPIFFSSFEDPKPNHWVVGQRCPETPLFWGSFGPKKTPSGWLKQLSKLPDLEDTAGCNCLQIIEIMEAVTGEAKDGHRMHGCSKSLVQDFMNMLEGEPCGSDTNGGCNSDPEVFGSIECGQTVAGTAWADSGTRDTDWYAINLPDSGVNGTEQMTVTLVSDFEGVNFILSGPPDDCSSIIIESTGCSDNGLPINSATATLDAPGTYTLFVATGMCDTSGIFDGFSCEGGVINYMLTVECSD